MVKEPFIFQVTGFQNSGKSTLVKKIIQLLAESNLTAATLKHHGHGGKPSVLETKDSSQHVSAGALAAIVEGDGRLLLQAERQSWNLEEQLTILNHFTPDIIIIEGYKMAHYPKIVMVKEWNDQSLLSTLTNIQAVVYWNGDFKQMETKFPTIPFFSIHDSSVEKWLIHYLKVQLKR